MATLAPHESRQVVVVHHFHPATKFAVVVWTAFAEVVWISLAAALLSAGAVARVLHGPLTAAGWAAWEVSRLGGGRGE